MQYKQMQPVLENVMFFINMRAEGAAPGQDCLACTP